MNGLVCICDRAAFDQIDHALCEQFCMNAQPLFIPKRRADRFGNSADAQLEGRAVGDFIGNEATDYAAGFIRLHAVGGGERCVMNTETG